MIGIDAVWLAVEPLDMRAGTETALARVVKVFGEAQAHHGLGGDERGEVQVKCWSVLSQLPMAPNR